MVTYMAALSSHTCALNLTAVAMCCAPPAPMELRPRLCVRHHARHHTNMHHTVNTCVHRPTPRVHQHNTPPTTRIPHQNHALKARQSRVPPHSRRDVLCSRLADGVAPKTMCASPCPPPHTNMHHTVNTCLHRPPRAHHQPRASRTTSNTPHPRSTHTHTHTHALETAQSRVPPHSRRDVLCSSIADGVVPKTVCASPCPPPHTNMHHTVNTVVTTACLMQTTGQAQLRSPLLRWRTALTLVPSPQPPAP